MARPEDNRKGRGHKGVHTEDEKVPIGKKDQAKTHLPKDEQSGPPHHDAPEHASKHAGGHEGQKPKR